MSDAVAWVLAGLVCVGLAGLVYVYWRLERIRRRLP